MTAAAAASSLGLTWPAEDGTEAGEAEDMLDDTSFCPPLLPLPIAISDASLGFLRAGGAIADDPGEEGVPDAACVVPLCSASLCFATHCWWSLVSIMDPSRLHGMSLVIP